MPSNIVFRVFISSTFSDLKAERNALQERVFPKLRDLCASHGARFQAIDLRWGVSEEAALDQQTMRICLEEISRCQRVTPRPNFIALLGDRYGWRPLPFEVEAGEFETVLRRIPDTAERARVERWYRRDDNAIPPAYCLQPRTGQFTQYGSWEPEEDRIRAALASATGLLPAAARQKYISSATEQEIRRGMADLSSPDHCFAFFRNIDGLPEDNSAHEFTDIRPDGRPDADAAKQLDNLKRWLRERLPGQVVEYTAKWQDGAPTRNHIDALCEDVYRSLSEAVSRQIAAVQETDPLVQEQAAHMEFAAERTRQFVGRNQPLAAIRDYLSRDDESAFLVTGSSGSGKSAFMGKALYGALANHPDALIIARFVGATPSSVSLDALLRGLCEQIFRDAEFEIRRRQQLEAVKDTDPEAEYKRKQIKDRYEVPDESSRLSECLHRFMRTASKRRRVLVFLDALDQISEPSNGYDFGWVQKPLPPGVRLIVSTLPLAGLPPPGQWVPSSHVVEMAALSTAVGTDLLRRLLVGAGRKLQGRQERAVITGFAQDGRPLYLQLAFEEARRWRSYDPPPRLPGDVAGLVDRLFERLSDDHGPLLVSRGIAYLAAARFGLSEDEILDVLARDESYFAEFLSHARHDLPGDGSERQLPVVIWSRLFFDLEPYLVERKAPGGAVLAFYHRQPAEAAAATFLRGQDRRDRHAQLADYFASQTLRWDGGVYNERALSELAFHRKGAEDPGRLKDTLQDWRFLEGKAESHMLDELVEDLADAQLAMPEQRPEQSLLNLIHQAIRMDTEFLHRHPAALFQCLWNRGWWYDCPALKDHVIEPEGGWRLGEAPWDREGTKLCAFVERWRSEKEREQPGFLWLRSSAPPVERLGAQISAPNDPHGDGDLLKGDSLRNPPVPYGAPSDRLHLKTPEWGRLSTLSPDGNLLIEVHLTNEKDGAYYRTRSVHRVWDARTRTILATHRDLEGTGSIIWHPDGRRIIRPSYGGLVVLNAVTGDVLQSIDTNLTPSAAVSLSADGRTVATSTGEEPRPKRALRRSQRSVAAIDIPSPAAASDEPLPRDHGSLYPETEEDFEFNLGNLPDGPDNPLLDVFSETDSTHEFEFDEDDDYDYGDDIALTSPPIWVVKHYTGAATEAAAEGEIVVRRLDLPLDPAHDAVRLSHPHGVSATALSSDGSRLAYACYGARVHLHDLASNQELWHYDTSEKAVIRLCFSSDGRRVGTVLDYGPTLVLDAQTGEVVGNISDGYPDLMALVEDRHAVPWLALWDGDDIAFQLKANRTPYAWTDEVRSFPLRPGGSARTWLAPFPDGRWRKLILEGADPLDPDPKRSEWPWDSGNGLDLEDDVVLVDETWERSHQFDDDDDDITPFDPPPRGGQKGGQSRNIEQVDATGRVSRRGCLSVVVTLLLTLIPVAYHLWWG